MKRAEEQNTRLQLVQGVFERATRLIPRNWRDHVKWKSNVTQFETKQNFRGEKARNSPGRSDEEGGLWSVPTAAGRRCRAMKEQSVR